MSTVAPQPARLNIFSIAFENSENVRERYLQTLRGAGEAAPAIERFLERVERDAHASINAKSSRLLAMLRNGFYPNPYDEARARASAEGGDSEDYLREHQRDHYRQRVAFDRAFEDGEAFRYAALNIGGTGPSYYGPYCLVVRDPHPGEPAALLPANSLERFIVAREAGPTLDEASLRREIAPWSNRHHLAATKHANAVESTPDSEWPTMMCHATNEEQCFVEVILGSTITPQTLTEIRVDRARGRLQDLLARAGTDTLTADEHVELAIRVEVVEALQGLHLEALYKEV